MLARTSCSSSPSVQPRPIRRPVRSASLPAGSLAGPAMVNLSATAYCFPTMSGGYLWTRFRQKHTTLYFSLGNQAMSPHPFRPAVGWGNTSHLLKRVK